MAQIDTSRDALLLLIQRLEREHGATVLSNFALDEQLNRAEAAIQQQQVALAEKEQTILALVNRAQTAEAACEALREQLDPKRKGRFRGPHGKAGGSGADEAQSS